MSNISTIYDGLITKADTLFGSTQNRIPQPYDLPSNKTIDLRLAYGLKYNNRSLANVQTTKAFRKSYVFSMVFAIEVLYLPSDITPLDTAVKSLLESESTWSLNAYDPAKLDLGLAADIINVQQADGIFPIYEDKNNYLSIETFFEIQTKEITLTC